MTSIAGSSNVLIPEARAKISMRIVPGSDPVAELDALVRHLESHAPWGAQVSVERTKQAPPFRCAPTGRATRRHERRWRTRTASRSARPVREAPSRCSRRFRASHRAAEFILWGPEDVAGARIHASDESVDPAEIEAMTVAQILLLDRLAQQS